MKVGDMVRWTRFNQDESLYDNLKAPKERWNDLGIIIDIDVWDFMETEPETIIIEVYFFKVGIVWCNPKSLEVVSIIKDTD
tara:strand:- start:65 stop:307 length:243 start_codon:yes stop_codon:yes gene_type:complete